MLRVTNISSTFTQGSLAVRKKINFFSCLWAHDDEAGALHLAHVVESEETHEAARVLHLAVVDLLEHLAGVRAAVHRQLVHRPVAVVVVSGGHHVRGVSADGEAILLVGELNAGHPAVVDEVLHLLGDLLVGERGEEGHVLVLLLVDGPHLNIRRRRGREVSKRKSEMRRKTR